MRFLIVTNVQHSRSGSQIGGYGPYVREMNLWLKHVDQVRVIGPIQNSPLGSIDLPYVHTNLEFVSVPAFDITVLANIARTLVVMPLVVLKIIQGMFWADHIHLRCPGNMGLLGCLIQMFFPSKKKTAKYAGNWDPESKQPWSYRVQRWLLKNTILTHNMQTLVYGHWPGQTRNIKPFFTATYHDFEIEPLKARSLNNQIKIVFVGGLTVGKRPLLAVQAVRALIERGLNVSIELMGEGKERSNLESFIAEHHLSERICLLGNVDAITVKNKFQEAHFLLFLSRSEGWPKVVAEAMFWGCVPITTRVSCVPSMLGEGLRGALIDPTVDAAVSAVIKYLNDEDLYQKHVSAAADWSRQFTLEKFETEVVDLLSCNSLR